MGGAEGEAFCPSSSVQIRIPQHLIRVSHQLPTWVLILPILQTRKLTPSRLFILSHTDTKRQRWVFMPAQGSSHCTTAVPRLGNWLTQHLVTPGRVPWAPPLSPSLPHPARLTKGCTELAWGEHCSRRDLYINSPENPAGNERLRARRGERERGSENEEEKTNARGQETMLPLPPE